MEEERQRCRELLARYIAHIGGARSNRDLLAVFHAIKSGLPSAELVLPAPPLNPPR